MIRIILSFWLAVMFASADAFGESTMEPLSKAKNIIAEIWCVKPKPEETGWQFFYVEKTTNETFQFFQITQNGGMAVKVIPCTGNEVKIVTTPPGY